MAESTETEKIFYVFTVGTKWDIEKFSGNNNFDVWKGKMEIILIQHKCGDALKGEAKMSLLFVPLCLVEFTTSESVYGERTNLIISPVVLNGI